VISTLHCTPIRYAGSTALLVAHRFDPLCDVPTFLIYQKVNVWETFKAQNRSANVEQANFFKNQKLYK
jgi:hypothetical protein